MRQPLRTVDLEEVLRKIIHTSANLLTPIDEKRLAAFSAKAAIALENVRLFEDVLNMKNYNESSRTLQTK